MGKENKLNLLRDTPEFESVYSSDRDKFNHKVYAETLGKIIQDNSPPLVIGLLGGWGIGKSTILNLFKKLIKEIKGIRYVYFNAWKYSNDSFRRQFLLECADQLIDDIRQRQIYKACLSKRFISTNEPAEEGVLLRDKLKNLKKYWKTFLPRIKFDANIILKIFVVIVSLCMLLWVTRKCPDTIPKDISTIGVLGILFIYILKDLLPNLFKINAPVAIDSRIVFPEEFKKEFLCIRAKCKDKVVFVIDDVDRCPPHIIMNVLDSIKNFFVPRENTNDEGIYDGDYFIIAMDDKAVVSILEKERGGKYKNEEVLKFFDVAVRINPVSSVDLTEFAHYIAKETIIDPEVINIAIYGGFNTPRKIKHFLNTYKTVFSVVEQRIEEKQFFYKGENLQEALAKTLVLQIAFAKHFESLKANYDLLEEWYLEAEKMFSAEVKDGSQKDENHKNKFGLLKFIWTTKDTKLNDIEGLIYLKSPSYGQYLTNHFEFGEAIINNEQKKILELCEEIKTEEQQAGLVALIRHLFDTNPMGSFLRNRLSACLTIFKEISFKKGVKKALVRIIERNLLRHKDILDFSPNIIFSAVKFVADENQVRKSMIKLGLQNIAKIPPVNNTVEFINILNEKNYIDTNRANILNKSLEDIADKNPQWVVEVFNNASVSLDEKWEDLQNKVPSSSVTVKLLQHISEKEEAIDLFSEIFSVVNKFWFDEHQQIISQKCMSVLNYGKSQNIKGLNGNIRLALRMIIEMKTWISKEEAPAVCDLLWNLVGRISLSDEIKLVLEAVSIAAYSNNETKAMNNGIVQKSLVLEIDNYRELIEFVDEYLDENKWWVELKNQIISVLVENVKNSLLEKNKLKFDYLTQKKEIQDQQMKIVFMAVFECNNQKIFELWQDSIIKVCNSVLRRWVIDEIKKTITGKPNVSKDIKETMLCLLINIVDEPENAEEKIEVGNLIFDILKRTDVPSIHLLGIKNLEKTESLFGDLFTQKINGEIQSICRENQEKILQHKELLIACIKMSNIKHDQETMEAISSALNVLITTNNNNYLDMGYAVLTVLNGKKIPKTILKKMKDSTALINNQKEKERWETLLNNR
ncbi:MAG: hypothetical protein KJ915_10490 [Candidatus Omnitrophica bacterium]|nr:hypothetical protein [Candidatus Omnitrophota bacterium]